MKYTQKCSQCNVKQAEAFTLIIYSPNSKNKLPKSTKTFCFYDYYLYACMAAQVEVKLKGVSDTGVHCGPCRNIPTLPNLHKMIKIKTCEIWQT